METTNRIARLTLAAGLAGAGALLLPAPAGAEVIDGNPGCADLAPAGETWVEFKIDSNPSVGDHAANGGTITVAKPDEFTVAWTSTVPVVAFIMKGGPNADVQLYDPAATEGSGSTPINDSNGTNFGISHVTWCFPTEDPPVEEEPPAEEEPPVTESTPEPEVTTTTQAPTQVLGAQEVRSASQAAALPRTGSSDGALAAAGAAAILVGAVFLRRSRRVEASHFEF